MNWKNDKPTEKQIALLAKMADYFEGVNTKPLTKGEASKEIDEWIVAYKREVRLELIGYCGDIF